MRPVTVVLALALPGSAACLLTTDLDRLHNGAAPLSDAGYDVLDGGGDVVDGQGGVVVVSESFEGADQGSCKPYAAYFGATQAATPAHGGERSCLVCSTGPSPDRILALIGITVPSPRAGEHYRGEAWVRASPDHPASAKFAIGFRLLDENSTQIDGKLGNDVPVESDWFRASVDWTLTKSAPTLAVNVGGFVDAAGTCFLVDDVTIWRDP